MKIGITGNSAGIGKSISELPYEFIQFNRADGDIHNVELVYEKFKDCDIFINNAWDNDCQIKLLNYFFSKWRDVPKKIISIGSSISTYKPSSTGYDGYVDLKKKLRQAHCDIVNLNTERLDELILQELERLLSLCTGYEGYVDLKKKLRQAHCDIVNLKTTKCKSYLVNPGLTDTKMTVYRKDNKMLTQDVADIVKFIIENKLYIPEIYFYVE